MNKKQRTQRRLTLTMFFTLVVLLASITTTLVISFLLYLLIDMEIWEFSVVIQQQLTNLLLFQTFISLPIGMAIAFLVGRIPLKPMGQLVENMHALANGKFETRMEPKGLLWKYPAYSEVSDCFNMLAEELENTEMLRSDFINNFSHEFKTPIVSIAGFAKLVQRGNLTEAQKQEYLDIIEHESLRLSYMATNVLNLSKVENQTILTDLTKFNLAEQIRDSILLLVNKWEPKQLDFRLELEEINIRGNEELLKQVWINLLHNAIKFTPQEGLVEVEMKRMPKAVSVSVTNHGSEIPPEALNRIFNKFYQADESHTTEGNGVGLAIVKRVVTLHNGTISVTSNNQITTFTVTLPIV